MTDQRAISAVDTAVGEQPEAELVIVHKHDGVVDLRLHDGRLVQLDEVELLDILKAA